MAHPFVYVVAVYPDKIAVQTELKLYPPVLIKDRATLDPLLREEVLKRGLTGYIERQVFKPI